MMRYLAKSRLFWTLERDAVVGEHDPAAAWLFASLGAPVPSDDVERHDLVARDLVIAEGGDAVEVAEVAEAAEATQIAEPPAPRSSSKRRSRA